MPDNHTTHDDELELEPVDPEILANQRQRAESQTDKVQAAVDDELIQRSEDPGDPLTLEVLKNFHYTKRHLMIVTAIVVMVMAVCQLAGKGAGLFITATLTVSAGWLFTMRHQRRHEAKVEQMRRDMAAKRKAKERAANHASGNASVDTDSAEGDLIDAPLAVTKTDPSETVNPIAPRSALKISFSMKEMLLAFTVAIILLALVNWLGAGPLAILLGMIALGGLVVQALGIETPPIVIFGWWILLMLYLMLGLFVSL